MDKLEEFKTTSGYTAHLKTELSYGEFIEIQKVLIGSMKFDIEKRKVEDFSPSAIFDSNKKAVEFIVKKLVLPDGKESNNIVQSIYEMPRGDGIQLTARINEITSDNSIDEKKGA